MHHQSWEGPLPSPATLEAFRDIVPDAPERIFRQWEVESAHRRDYEMMALKGSIARDQRGQLAAIAFALSALATGIIALFLGYPAVAGVVVGTTIVSVVAAFLYQRRKS
ncbi:hypothetical protein FG93_01118 [Bosea sp. LC85]|nr:DUF2335 domain-containing protein [Bosea sp. LC85]KFC74532.1 hypothetical protein FG93_01118 [Bosea sp. LC85]